MSSYDNDQQAYDDEPRDYRDRTDDRNENGDSRARSASPDGRDRVDSRPAQSGQPTEEEEEEARNPGTNLFVTGIHPRLSEEDIIRLFEKYGSVEKCNIMRDPHTKDSRGFGFVNMQSGDEADAAREGLQGEVYEGRTLSIEKARRARPRTPTPGRYYGPPKNDNRGPPRRRGGYGEDRYYSDDRRGGYGRRDDPYRYPPRQGGGGGGGRYGDDRYGGGYGGGGRRDRYDDRPPRGGERYGRDDPYGGPPSRGGGGGGGGRDYYDRESRGGRGPPSYADAPPARGGYDDAPPPAPADDRYARR